MCARPILFAATCDSTLRGDVVSARLRRHAPPVHRTRAPQAQCSSSAAPRNSMRSLHNTLTRKRNIEKKREMRKIRDTRRLQCLPGAPLAVCETASRSRSRVRGLAPEGAVRDGSKVKGQNTRHYRLIVSSTVSHAKPRMDTHDTRGAPQCQSALRRVHGLKAIPQGQGKGTVRVPSCMPKRQLRAREFHSRSP